MAGMGGMADFIFLGFKITIKGDCSHEIKKKKKETLAPWKKSYDKPRQYIKKQRHQFSDKGSKLCFFQYSCKDVKNGP